MSTLVVEVARLVGADVIIRGLRAVSDFENELQMAQMNHQLSGIETLFVPTGATYSFISSPAHPRGRRATAATSATSSRRRSRKRDQGATVE